MFICSFATVTAVTDYSDVDMWLTLDDVDVSGTDLFDISGVPTYDGVLDPMAMTGDTGIINQAVYTDAYGEFLVAHNANIDLDDSRSWAVSMWVNPDTVGSSNWWFFDKTAVDTTNANYCLIDGGATDIRCKINSVNVQGGTVVAGSWNFVVWQYNMTNDKVELWVDNVLIGNTSVSGQTWGSTADIHFGSRFDGVAGFDGRMDEVSIASQYTKEEISELYNSGAAFVPSFGSTVSHVVVDSQIYAGVQLLTFNASLTINGTTTTHTTTNGTINTGKVFGQYYNLTVSSIGTGANINQTFISQNQSIFTFNYSLIDVSAYNKITLTPVTLFNLTVKNASSVSEFYGITTNGTEYIYTLPETYDISITPTGFVDTDRAGFVAALGYQNLSFGVYADNSIYLTAYNASTSIILNTTSVTVTIEGANISYTNITTTGILFTVGLPAGQYNVTVASPGFETGTYVVTVGTNTFQTLDAYMSDETDTDVVMTIRNLDTNSIIEGAVVTIEKKINLTYQVVGTKISDVSARIQYGYESGATYRFTVVKTNYDTKSFVLDPIIFSTYTIRLTATQEIDDTSLFAGVSIQYSPETYLNNKLNNVSVTFANPDGALILMGFTITASNNATILANSSTNAYGKTLYASYGVYDATSTDGVSMIIYYQLADGTYYNTSYVFPIGNTVSQSGAGTFLQNQENPWDLSLFDRVLITVLVTIFAAGLTFAFGGTAVGGFVGLSTFAYLGYIGFVPFWAIAVPLITLFSIVAWGASR